MKVIIAFLLGMFAAGLILTQAKAHDWYDTDCCSGRDCQPVPAETMEEIGADTWRYKVTGNVFQNEPKIKRIRPSRDGQFHVCIGVHSFNKGQSLCLYIPVNS